MTAFFISAGLLFAIAIWPFIRGRRSSEGFNSGNNIVSLVGIALMWPILLAGILWIAIIWYRNYWIDYLNFRDETRMHKIKLEFNNRWSEITDENKIKFKFESHLDSLNLDINKLSERILQRSYTLDSQRRNGLWWGS